jgi:nitroreductase
MSATSSASASSSPLALLPAAVIAAAAVSSAITYYYASTRRHGSGGGGGGGGVVTRGADSAQSDASRGGNSSPFAIGWADDTFRERYDAQPRPIAAAGVALVRAGLPGPNATAALIRQRRSVFPKDFSAEHRLPLHIIEEMLDAANWAPTHGKTEPWRFVVAGSDAIVRVLDIRDAFMTALLTEKGDDAGLARHKKKMASKRAQLAKCSAIVFIVRAKVANGRGKFMPEWEETAAVACAVQNLHLQVTSRWQEGVAGYWSSGGHGSWLDAPALRTMLGMAEKDVCLGGFYLGHCDPNKMDKYRAKRGSMAEKVKWVW